MIKFSPFIRRQFSALRFGQRKPGSGGGCSCNNPAGSRGGWIEFGGEQRREHQFKVTVAAFLEVGERRTQPRSRGGQLPEALDCRVGLVTEAREFVGVQPAGFTELMDVDPISLVPAQGVSGRLQPTSQQRVEHVNFRSRRMEPFSPRQVIDSGSLQ